MKQVPLYLMIFMLTSFTFKEGVTFELDIKKDFVKTETDLFISKYETSNVEYRNFLADLVAKEKTDLYNASLPDTACWRDMAIYNEPFVQYYFRAPAYDYYPVVGISYESAVDYCAWLSTKYNADADRKFKKVTFVLPTREEWIFAANKGDTSKIYTWGSGFIQNNRKQDLCNYRHVEYKYDSLTKRYLEVPPVTAEEIRQRKKITAPVKAYFPNSFGIYNMCGNVTEMTSEKGFAQGGSFNDPAFKVTILSERKYSKPSADVGFRIAMRVVEQ